MNDELTLYDVTRDELRRRLSGRFPADFDLEKLEGFFDLSLSEKKSEQYACLVAVRRAG